MVRALAARHAAGGVSRALHSVEMGCANLATGACQAHDPFVQCAVAVEVARTLDLQVDWASSRLTADTFDLQKSVETGGLSDGAR